MEKHSFPKRPNKNKPFPPFYFFQHLGTFSNAFLLLWPNRKPILWQNKLCCMQLHGSKRFAHLHFVCPSLFAFCCWPSSKHLCCAVLHFHSIWWKENVFGIATIFTSPLFDHSHVPAHKRCNKLFTSSSSWTGWLLAGGTAKWSSSPVCTIAGEYDKY